MKYRGDFSTTEGRSAPATQRSKPRASAEALPTDLLAQASQRQPEALALFFEHYFDAVYALVHRLLGDVEAAEDVSQEVFYRVHRSIDRLDSKRDAKPWLTAIAYNACRDYWRSRAYKMSRHSQSIDETSAIESILPRSGDDPEESALARERERLVRSAIARLPERLRTTVVLHEYHGMAHEEIARLTGESHSAVRKRYSRALAELARSLRELIS